MLIRSLKLIYYLRVACLHVAVPPAYPNAVRWGGVSSLRGVGGPSCPSGWSLPKPAPSSPTSWALTPPRSPNNGEVPLRGARAKRPAQVTVLLLNGKACVGPCPTPRGRGPGYALPPRSVSVAAGASWSGAGTQVQPTGTATYSSA